MESESNEEPLSMRGAVAGARSSIIRIAQTTSEHCGPNDAITVAN